MLSACAEQTAANLTGTGDSTHTSQSQAAPLYTSKKLSAPVADISQSRFGAQALIYLELQSAKYGIADAPNELAFIKETTDALRQKHVRFQQVKDGVPVWSHQLIVHFDERDHATGITGSFLTGLDRIDVEPAVSADTAEATAVMLKGQDWQTANSGLYIYLHESQPRLAYQITLTRGVSRWFVFVDAHSGAVLHQTTGMPTIP